MADLPRNRGERRLLCFRQGGEIHQALTLATPVRSIVPHVQALAAVATALPPEEREPVLVIACQAASRSFYCAANGVWLVDAVPPEFLQVWR